MTSMQSTTNILYCYLAERLVGSGLLIYGLATMASLPMQE
jgi:hypothetical protein